MPSSDILFLIPIIVNEAKKKKNLKNFFFALSPQCRKCSAVKINSMTDAGEHPEESKGKKSLVFAKGVT